MKKLPLILIVLGMCLPGFANAQDVTGRLLEQWRAGDINSGLIHPRARPTSTIVVVGSNATSGVQIFQVSGDAKVSGVLTVGSCVGCGGGGGSSNEWQISGTVLTATTTATIVQVFGIASSTELRTPSGTIATLFGTNSTFTNGTTTNLRFTSASGTQMTLTGFLQGATISMSGQSSLAAVSSTNITASGFLQGASGNIANVSSTNLTVSGLSQLGTITVGTWNGTDIDISDYTNLAVTDPITLTGDTVGFTNSAGYSSSSGANPTATAGTTAVNGSATTFMRSDGAPKINDKFASSSITFNIYEATTTYPKNFAKWRTEIARTITEISCNEVSGTSTIEVYRATSNIATSSATQILGSITCGPAGSTSNSFVSSTLTAGSVLMVNTTGSNLGTPEWTAVNIYLNR